MTEREKLTNKLNEIMPTLAKQSPGHIHGITEFILADRKRTIEEYKASVAHHRELFEYSQDKIKRVVEPLVELGQIKKQPLPSYEELCQAIEETIKNAGVEK